MSSYQGTTLPSVAALSQKTEAPESQGSRREDWRKAKELEEARKAGTAPALVDEEGKDINPHIPQYIATVPWYVGIDKPTLKHQRPQRIVKDVSAISNWYKKGVQEGTLSTKFRKGACENCGSLTHKRKDCVERPRKVGAKFSGEDLAPDEHLQPNLHFDYDGKRDRWNGYNPEEHEAVVEEYAKMEEAKKQLKAKKLQNEMISVDMEKERDSDESDADEDKYADSFDMPGTNFDSKRRITVRNLRIREDTAKYLYNLRPNSAYYDPKTRSMRDNPSRDINANPDDLKFAGDNFIREGGDTVSMAKAQMFAWDASNRGTDVHLQAEPTKLDLLHKEFGSKKDNFKKSQKETILQRYGGEEHLEAPPKQLLLAQTEEYIEYSRHGTIIKGQEKAPVKSKYEEDVLLSNHFSVWGSFWRDGQWGFRCCYSLVRGSYCTGAAGRMAATEDSVVLPTEPSDALPGIEEEEEEEEEPVKSMVEQHKEKLNLEKEKKKEKRRKKKRKQKELRKQKEKEEKKKKKKKRRHSSDESDSSDSSSDDSSEEEEEQEDEEAIRKRKIKEAMKRQEEHEKEVDRLLAMDERKRPYNSLNSYDSVRQPTEEEMEAYRLKRARLEDPMAAFLKPY